MEYYSKRKNFRQLNFIVRRLTKYGDRAKNLVKFLTMCRSCEKGRHTDPVKGSTTSCEKGAVNELRFVKFLSRSCDFAKLCYRRDFVKNLTRSWRAVKMTLMEFVKNLTKD